MPRRILVDHNGFKGMGDVVCELSLYDAVRRRHSDAEISSRGSRMLAWGHPAVDAFDESTPIEAFDEVIRILHYPQQLGPGYREAMELGHRFVDRIWLAAGFLPPADLPRLYVLPRELDALGIEHDGGDDLVIAYSADSRDASRRWGGDRFRELARYLESVHGASLIEIGSGITEGRLGVGYDLVGQTDLRQSAAVLSLADLFIGNHGGLTHLAGAVGTPILSPWGASFPYDRYAYDQLSLAVEPDVPCKNCAWTGAVLPQCQALSFHGKPPCTDMISLDEMIRAAETLIARVRGHRAELRRAKAARSAAACDPEWLIRFEWSSQVTLCSHYHITLGGSPGWVADHQADLFLRLQKIVAFPDWGSSDDWKQLVGDYVTAFEANDDWALQLSTDPLSGDEARQRILDFLIHELRPAKTVPKLILIPGGLSLAERLWLRDSAAAYVATDGPLDQPLADHPSRVPCVARVGQLPLR